MSRLLVTMDNVDIYSWQSSSALVAATILLFYIARSIQLIFFHPLSSIPGPKFAATSNLWYTAYAFTGNLPSALERVHKQYGSVVRIGPNRVTYSSIKGLHDIYSTPRGKDGNGPFLKTNFYDILAVDSKTRGLVAETDPIKHAHARELFAHKFNAEAVPDGLLQPVVEIFSGKLRKNGQGEKGIELNDLFSMCTFDVMGAFVFGKSFDTLKNEEVHDWVRLIPDCFRWGVKFDSLRNYVGTTAAKIFIKVFAPHMIKARAKAREYTLEQMIQGREHSDPEKQHDCLIDYCHKVVPKNETKLTEREIVAHAATLVIAGTETTASAMASTTYFIAKNPHVYAKLRDEIRSSFDNVDDITCASTTNLKYLRAVINESLRMFPSVSWGSIRECPGAVVDGIYIPAGTEISAATYAMAHSDDYFTNPYDFIPERWMDHRTYNDKRMASQPFLIGPRNCLGRNVALVQMRLLLCKILFQFDFELVNQDLDWLANCGSYSVWPVKPELYVRFQERKVAA